VKPFDLFRSTILLTGGTGSFGTALIRHLLSNKKFKGIIRVFSRDEFKQYQLQQKYPDDLRLRYLIGDVRDVRRLSRAVNGADVVIHAAALKQIPIAEYNPFEVIKTNILGSQNVVESALDGGIPRTLLISSDKAVHPVNLYGATKLAAEKLFVQGNVYRGRRKVMFSVARYGNVLGSRGSVVPLFLKQKKTNALTITHKDMTRFWITLPQAADFVIAVLRSMDGGEIFVPKLPSVKIMDLARVIAPDARLKFTEIRIGEKLHEELIAFEESDRCKVEKNHYILIPQVPHWSKKQLEYPKYSHKFAHRLFSYRSDTNTWWLSRAEIRQALSTLKL
jgi:UDP-N-acetylglucosamine 4,6-dehydratase